MTQGEEKINSTQWALVNGNYSPSMGTSGILPAGKYKIEIGITGTFFKPVPIITDQLIEIEDSLSFQILQDIDLFWTKGDSFKRYGFLHRRGYLLFGEPGSGKSCLAAQIARRLINQGGIIFNCDSPDDLSKGLKIFREIEPNRPIVCMFEDLDSIIDYHCEQDVLSLLDGEDQVDKVVNIATTNYPENLPPRLLKRPRRFDRIYEIGNPNFEQRIAFFTAKLHPQDMQEVDLNKWASETEGFNFAALTDLIISTICLAHPFEESLCIIRDVLKGRSLINRLCKDEDED